jgi:hypothetical protein
MDGAPVILNASDAGGLLACKRRHAFRHARADSRRGAGFRGLRGAAHATVPAEGAETHVGDNLTRQDEGYTLGGLGEQDLEQGGYCCRVCGAGKPALWLSMLFNSVIWTPALKVRIRIRSC